MTENRVIALGFFDGVHLGHASLLKRTAEVAKEKGLKSAVITFDEHPLHRVCGKNIPLLTSALDRTCLIRDSFGIEEVMVLRFNKSFMEMPWEKFFEILVSDYHAVHLVFGHDYSCGYLGQGTVEKIKERCLFEGIGFDVLPPVEVEGIRVSSSVLREIVASGDMERAGAFYGHPHVLTGTVRTGKKLGRTIDAPTVNLCFPDNVIEPRFGVYAVKVKLPDGRYLSGVTNVGVRPTVEDSTLVTAETYILDYCGDLYGQQITLYFYHFIRPEQRFSSLEELKERIHADAAAVKLYFRK